MITNTNLFQISEKPQLSDAVSESTTTEKLSNPKKTTIHPSLIYELCKKHSHIKLNPNEDESFFEGYMTNICHNLKSLTKIPEPSKEFLQKKSIKLPPKDPRKKKTLLLDLDETLIHTNQIKDGNIDFKIRPFCKNFLQSASQSYEIFIFTSATSRYAEIICNLLDPDGLFIDGIISRDHCLITKLGYSIKDVRIISNRDIEDVLLVDNSIVSFGKVISNGIPIPSFIDNENDKELFYLLEILERAADFKDSRIFVEMYFQLKQIQKEIV